MVEPENSAGGELTGPADGVTHETLRALRAHLTRLEALLGGASDGAPGTVQHGVVPAWRRRTATEARWPVTVLMLAVIGLQVALPDRLALSFRWLLPGVEAVLLIALVAANPRRIEHRTRWLRPATMVLIAVASVANGYSAIALILGLVAGREGTGPAALLSTGGAIWLTNVLVFTLWYWELDRGGPVARALGNAATPDLLFPQMTTPHLGQADWEPEVADYLYVSFTNATAFSPTDTMPLTRWTKMAMLAQSLISLITVALVIARAVNILK